MATDTVDIRVVDDPARTVAERLAAAAEAGGHVALTGGRTPGRAYELAAALAPDWGRCSVWWGDERCVAPDDERSNYRLARETLLDRVAPGPVHRIPGELGRDAAAAAYEGELAELETFDLVLLGIGPDGHVASLFPNRATLDERTRRAIGAEAHLEPLVDRVTLTLPRLRGTRELVFLVTGAEKAEAVRRAFAEPPSASTPASLVRADAGATVAVLDAAAASAL